MQSRKKIILGLDTSGAPLLVALERDGKVVSRRRKGVKQERLLFPAVNSALEAAGAELQDIERIFIVRGPGRFTGIRISLTFASMLKYLNKTEVRGATLFEVLRRQVETSKKFAAWKKANPSGALAVVLHAFREEYFLQIFDGQNAGPAWLSREELLQRLSGYSAPLMLAGSDKNGAPLAELAGSQYAYADEKDCFVRPATLTAMAKDDSLAQDALEPLYLKPARFELVTPK